MIVNYILLWPILYLMNFKNYCANYYFIYDTQNPKEEIFLLILGSSAESSIIIIPRLVSFPACVIMCILIAFKYVRYVRNSGGVLLLLFVGPLPLLYPFLRPHHHHRRSRSCIFLHLPVNYSIFLTFSTIHQTQYET